jgi:8-oxo-dGTP pyrophosphatase MutT (NUDIX family)
VVVFDKKWRPLAASIVRWFTAGLVFMGLNTGLLYVLVQRLGLKVPLATLLCAEICTLLRYVMNDVWVFRSGKLTWLKLWQYHVANGTAFVVWWVAANVLNRIGIHYLVASILAVGFSTTISLASNYLWIWRRAHGYVDGARCAPRMGRKVVAGIILLRGDGAALLQLRDDKPTIQDPGIWVVPGGHVEAGESPADGARREFLEETRYACSNPRLLASYPSRPLGYDGDFDLVFFWDRYDGIQGIECREGQALRFVSRAEAESLPRRDYLTKVWDLALSASDGRQDLLA